MEPLPNENKENHLQQRLKDAARKNVVFSPNRLGPTATVPSSSQKSSFQPKSILKTPSKVMPFSLFASPTREDRSEDSAEEDDFVVTAVGALRRDEVNDRIDAYQMLHTKFRVCDETPYLATVEENIETFVEAFKRDIAQTECNGLTHATLRCLGFFLFQPSIVPMFPAAAILDLLTLLVSKIHETQDKVTCNLAVWCIAIQRMPAKIVAPLTPRLVDALVYAMRSPFKSVTIQNESLAALDVLFKQTPTAVGLQAPTWLPPVLEYLTHPISGLRSKALHVLTGSLPRVVEEQERIEDLIGEFLENRSTKFAKDLEELLTSHEEKYVIYVWGAVVALLGRKLHRSLALNHLLKVLEKCFNTRKNEVKVSAYAAWTRLIYNFSLNNHLLHEKRIKLIKTPLDNCFLNEKAVAVKMAGTRAWMALIFACGDGLTKCFEPVITTVMRLVLTDECDEVRVTGFGILSSLFSGDVPSESLNPPPYSRIPAPYGDTKILLRDENLEPADIHRLDPKWVRANVSVFLELLLLGLRSQVRVEPVTAAESATVGNNQEEKEAWCKGDVTGRPIVTKLFMDTWTDLMRVLQLVNQKEINPSPEGIMSLHECLRFVAKVAAMDGDDLAPSSIARTAYGDWTAKMEIVKLLTDSLITYYTSRVLVSSKYRMVEEEERWGVVEGARKVVVTPLVFLIRQWLDMPSIFVGTDFEHVYWTMITPFVGMVGGAMDALLAVLGVLVARKGERTEQDRTFRAKWWKFMAEGLKQHINDSNEISDELNPFEEGCHPVIYDLLLYPIKETICLSPNSATIDEPSLKAWNDLLEVFYLAALTKVRDANSTFDNLAARIAHELAEVGDAGYETGVLSTSVLMICAILDTIKIGQAPKETTSLFGSHAFGKSLVKESKHLAHKKAPLESLLSLTSILLQRTHAWLGKVPQDTRDVPQFVQLLFTSVTALLPKSPKSNAVPLLMMSQGILSWVSDTDDLVAGLSKVVKKKYHGMINDLWAQVLSLFKEQPVHDTKLLETASEFLCAGLGNRQKPIVNATAAFWNDSFGKQAEIRYPNNVAEVLRPLRLVATITLPSWPEGQARREDQIGGEDQTGREEHTGREDQTGREEAQEKESEQTTQVVPPTFSQEESFSSMSTVELDLQMGPIMSPRVPRLRGTPDKSSRLTGDASTPTKRKRRQTKARNAIPEESLEYVQIHTTPQKPTVLTEHQQEKLKERRGVPVMYNSLDVSQPASLGMEMEVDEERDLTPMRRSERKRKASMLFVSPTLQTPAVGLTKTGLTDEPISDDVEFETPSRKRVHVQLNLEATPVPPRFNKEYDFVAVSRDAPEPTLAARATSDAMPTEEQHTDVLASLEQLVEEARLGVRTLDKRSLFRFQQQLNMLNVEVTSAWERFL